MMGKWLVNHFDRVAGGVMKVVINIFDLLLLKFKLYSNGIYFCAISHSTFTPSFLFGKPFLTQFPTQFNIS